MAEHLVFYDGECGLCDRVVQRLLRWDKKKILAFAPLHGTTAQKLLRDLPSDQKTVDSMIFIEQYQSSKRVVYTQGKAAFRIAWLMGGWWKALGWLFFLPSWLYNWGYNLIARNRKWLMPQTECFVPPPAQNHRFLP